MKVDYEEAENCALSLRNISGQADSSYYTEVMGIFRESQGDMVTETEKFAEELDTLHQTVRQLILQCALLLESACQYYKEKDQAVSAAIDEP